MERQATELDWRTYDIPDETGEAAELALLRSVGFADPEQWPPTNTLADDIPVFTDADGGNDRPEALEEHEVPGYRAEDDLDWPIITTDPKWLLDHGRSREGAPSETDWLERAQRAHGVVDPGTYDVEVLPRGCQLISTQKTRGISLLVRLVGDATECRLRFLSGGPDGIVRRDLSILKQWGDGLGVGKTVDLLGYVAALGRNGKGRRIMLGLDRRETPNGGVDIFATSVAVEGRRDG